MGPGPWGYPGARARLLDGSRSGDLWLRKHTFAQNLPPGCKAERQAVQGSRWAVHCAHENGILVGRVELQAKIWAQLIPSDLKVDVVDGSGADAT